MDNTYEVIGVDAQGQYLCGIEIDTEDYRGDHDMAREVLREYADIVMREGVERLHLVLWTDWDAGECLSVVTLAV